MSDNDYDIDYLEYEMDENHQREMSKHRRESFLAEKRQQAEYMVNSLSLSEIVDYARDTVQHPKYIPDRFTPMINSIIAEYEKKNDLSIKQRKMLALHYQMKEKFLVDDEPLKVPQIVPEETVSVFQKIVDFIKGKF